MSLLQDVLRTQTIDQTFSNLNLTERLQTQRADPESDEEIVGVVSVFSVRADPPAHRANAVGLCAWHSSCIPGSVSPHFAALVSGLPRSRTSAVSCRPVVNVVWFNTQRPSQGAPDGHIAAHLLEALRQRPRTLLAGIEEVESEPDSELW